MRDASQSDVPFRLLLLILQELAESLAVYSYPSAGSNNSLAGAADGVVGGRVGHKPQGPCVS
jgi:hypothetical protein